MASDLGPFSHFYSLTPRDVVQVPLSLDYTVITLIATIGKVKGG